MNNLTRGDRWGVVNFSFRPKIWLSANLIRRCACFLWTRILASSTANWGRCWVNDGLVIAGHCKAPKANIREQRPSGPIVSLGALTDILRHSTYVSWFFITSNEWFRSPSWVSSWINAVLEIIYSIEVESFSVIMKALGESSSSSSAHFTWKSSDDPCESADAMLMTTVRVLWINALEDIWFKLFNRSCKFFFVVAGPCMVFLPAFEESFHLFPPFVFRVLWFRLIPWEPEKTGRN